MKLLSTLKTIILFTVLLATVSTASLSEVSRVNLNPSSIGHRETYIAANGDYVYVGDRYSRYVYTIDIRNKNAPRKVRWLHMGSDITDIHIKNNHLFVATRDELRVYDLINPLTPTERFRSRISYLNKLYVSTNRLYVSNGRSFLIYDVSSNGSINNRGGFDLGIQNDHQLDIVANSSNTYAYIAGRATGIHVLNVSNPYSISQVRVIPNSNGCVDGQLEMTEDNQYLISTGCSRIKIYDLSTPSSPTLVSTTIKSGMREISIDSKNNILYGFNTFMTNSIRGIYEYDISAVSAPVQTHFENQNYINYYRFTDVEYQDGYVYSIHNRDFVIYSAGDSKAPEVTIDAASLRHGNLNGSITITADDSESGGSDISIIYYSIKDQTAWYGISAYGSVTSTKTMPVTPSLPLGTYEICAKAKDIEGNTSEPVCQSITLSNLAPTAVANTTLITPIDGNCEAKVLLNGNGSSDPESQSLAYLWTGVFGSLTYTSTQIILNAGEFNATLKVTDYYGATNSTSTLISVTDKIVPSLGTAPIIAATEATSPQGAVVSITSPSATDNCTSGIVVTSNAPSGNQFPLGTTTVTFTATDAGGNAASNSTIITVEDKTAPVIPAIENIVLEATGPQTPVTLPSVTATDIVDLSVLATHNGTATYALGVTEVIYTATDAAGNSSSSTITVTIKDETAPTLTAPADITLEATAPLTPVSISAAIALDIVDGSVAVTSDAPVLFAVGATTITFTAVDNSGNSAQEIMTVTVTDITAPVIPAIEDITLEATAAQTPVAMASVIASDLVDGNVATTNNAPTTFTVGATIVTFTTVDVAGNQAQATITVTIADQTAPVIPAIEDITLEATAAQTPVAMATVIASDLVDGDVATTNDAPATFTVGATIVTFTAVDVAGNQAQATITVTIADQTAPVIPAIEDITLEATAAQTPVAMATVIASDLVDGDVATTNDAPATFTVGATIVTFTAVDLAGNQAQATITITIADQTAPVLPAIEDITLEATAAQTPVAMATVIASDLVDGDVATTNDAPATFTVGATIVIFTAVDLAGNQAQATITITIADQTAPVLPAIEDITLEATAAQTPVAMATVIASDLVDGDVATTNDAPATFTVGATIVTFTAVDVAGNQAQATITITIADQTAPVIPAIENITLEATAAQTPVAMVSVIASDLVDGDVATTNDAPATFTVGATIVTFTAVDVAGNQAQATITVTIADQTAPVIPAIENITLEATAAQTPVAMASVIASDLVDGDVATTNDAPATFTVGATIVTFTAVDVAGNQAQATITVTIADQTAPVIPAIEDITLEATAAQTPVAMASVIASDLVDGNVATTNNAPTTFTVGATIVTFTAVDVAGNQAQATITVTIADQTAPVIPAIENITLEATAAQTPVAMASVIASDLVDGDVATTNDAPATFTVGATIVTFTAVDVAGNQVQATIIVTITDLTAPVIPAINNIVIEATGLETSVTMLVVTASDLVDGNVITTNNAPAQFVLGATDVIFTALDNAGNSSSATITVTVTDNTAPAIPVLENITVEATAALSPVTIPSVIALDLVDGNVATANNAPALFSVGDTEVTYSVTDNAGNTATTIITVTITDETAPIVTAPTSIIVEATATATPITVEIGLATDLVDEDLVPTNDAPSAFTVGITTVTYTSTDAAGNTGTATMTVTVLDETAPELTLLGNITVKPDGFLTTVSIPVGIAHDLVDGSITPTNDAPSEFPLGTTVVTYSVTDTHGNTTTGTIKVRVRFSDLYEIRNTNSDRCVEVYRAEKQNGANVQQWYCNNTFAQRWAIEHIGNGFYSLKNLNSGKLLNVQNKGLSENVEQWNTTVVENNQKWKITLNAAGIATLNPASDLTECLDIKAASTSDEANVTSYPCNGTVAQDFILTDASHKPTHISGVFEIRNDVSNKCVDVSGASRDYAANVQQWDCNYTGAQMWVLTHIEGEYYEIANYNSGLLLDVSWGGQSENVQQWGDVNGVSQRWRIVESGNGTYNFKPKSNNNECLDVQNQATWAGANIISVNCNGTGAQRFQLIDLDY